MPLRGHTIALPFPFKPPIHSAASRCDTRAHRRRSRWRSNANAKRVVRSTNTFDTFFSNERRMSQPTSLAEASATLTVLTPELRLDMSRKAVFAAVSQESRTCAG